MGMNPVRTSMFYCTYIEKYFKTGMGKRYIKNRIKRFLALTG